MAGHAYANTRDRHLVLKHQHNFVTIRTTRAISREQTKTLYGPERTMNQITVETNAVEIEAIEQVVANKEDAITELNFAQLAMVGGGEVVIIL
jgi:hypothetical protein